jgi:predicted enzyme involved in methoxymalonyl-ACP biosynthesis
VLDPDALRRIADDLALGREPVAYTDEMLAARERMRAEFEAFKAKNPNAVIHLPE